MGFSCKTPFHIVRIVLGERKTLLRLDISPAGVENANRKQVKRTSKTWESFFKVILSSRITACLKERSRSVLYQVLRDSLFLLLYKLQVVQTFFKEDKKRRLSFSEHSSAHPDRYSAQLSKVLFYGQCIFYRNGVEKQQNVSIRSTEIPEEHSAVVRYVLVLCRVVQSQTNV